MTTARTELVHDGEMVESSSISHEQGRWTGFFYTDPLRVGVLGSEGDIVVVHGQEEYDNVVVSAGGQDYPVGPGETRYIPDEASPSHVVVVHDDVPPGNPRNFWEKVDASVGRRISALLNR